MVLMRSATRSGCRTIESETTATVRWVTDGDVQHASRLAKGVCGVAQRRLNAPVSFLTKPAMPYPTGFKLVSLAFGNLPQIEIDRGRRNGPSPPDRRSDGD